MPAFEELDRRAVARAARVLAPMLRRRGWLLVQETGPRAHREVQQAIELLLEAIADDDALGDEHAPLWARVDPSGLVLVGVGRRAVIVGRVRGWGGLARRLLVP